MSMAPDPNPNQVIDERSFLEFVQVLAADRRLAADMERADPNPYGAAGGWENLTIEAFLEAAVAWAESTDFGRRQGMSDDVSVWRRLAVFLYTGKTYE